MLAIASQNHYEENVPDEGPFIPFLRGNICKLAERLCGPIILCGPSATLPWLATSSAILSLAPMDIIETERL
jgi:hypothetical protein